MVNTMDKIERQNQRETDALIMQYVRGMQQFAPLNCASIYNYLKNVAHRKRITEIKTQDRIDYLVSAGYLKEEKEWAGGEWEYFYEITADGQDLLDGNIPPRNP